MKHISYAAVYILVDRQGFDSMEALGLLTADDLDYCGMLDGQQKLVIWRKRDSSSLHERMRHCKTDVQELMQWKINRIPRIPNPTPFMQRS